MTRSPLPSEHGTSRRYRRGCRCEPCHQAYRDHEQARAAAHPARIHLDRRDADTLQDRLAAIASKGAAKAAWDAAGARNTTGGITPNEVRYYAACNLADQTGDRRPGVSVTFKTFQELWNNAHTTKEAARCGSN